MPKAFIRLGYLQVIDASCKDDFSKAVLMLSHLEFMLKCQAYNPENKFTTFSQLKKNDGRANSLHYKTGFAVAGLIESLQKKMPGVSDSFGNALLFDTYKFEVIESDITDIEKHIVAIYYFSDVCILHEIVGDSLLLSYISQQSVGDGYTDTFLLKIQGGLSVINYREAAPLSVQRDIAEHIIEA